MSRELDPREIQYGTLPARYREQMQAYIERGVRPAAFIQAVLDGDLFGAYNLAGPLPESGAADMMTVIGWVDGQCPVKAFGTVGAVERWIKYRGLLGMERERRQQEAQAYKDRVADIGGPQNIGPVRAFMAVISGRKA